MDSSLKRLGSCLENRGMSLQLALSLLIFLILPTEALAQRVYAVQVDRVLIHTDKLGFKPQQIWSALDDKGAPTGEIQILQVREEKAVGLIKSGYVVGDAFMRLKSEPVEKDPIKRNRMYLGPSILTTSVDVKVIEGADEASTTLKGSQFGLQLGADQVLTSHQVLRFRFGFDLLDTTGEIPNPPACESSVDCRLRIHYLTGSLGFLFQLMPEGSRLNMGLNVSFVGLLPISKSSNAIDESRIAVDGGFEFGAVVHYKTNPITWLEFSAQRIVLRESSAFKPTMTRYNIAWMQNF